MWDKDAKVKIKGFPESRQITTHPYPASAVIPILDCGFNSQGTIIAVAYGYDWCKGAGEYEEGANEIYAHICSKEEVEKRNKDSGVKRF